MSLLGFELFQRGLLAAALVGVAAPMIGIYLVQRRLSLMGDGIGHVAFAGVAAGLLTGTSPVIAAMIAATVGAIVIEVLRERGRIAGDVALAVIFYGGIAAGVFLASLSGVSTTSLFGVLFGQPLVISTGDIRLMFVIAALVVTVTTALRKEFFLVCYDEEVARASGLPVRALNVAIAVTAAVTIAVAMRVVGILLVSAMLVLPVATAQQLTRSFRATVVASVALGLVISVGGLVVAIYADVFPAATIVLAGLAAFALATAGARVTRAWR